MKLLTLGNPKTSKSTAYGWHTGILHLSPARTAGGHNVCPWASKGCLQACLNTAGRGGIFKSGETNNPIQEARKRRTRYMQAGDGEAFFRDLHDDLVLLQKQAKRLWLKPAVRLNGTSDLAWENSSSIMQDHPYLQFYDYTKSPDRMWDWLRGRLPDNYHLTFSRTEDNEADCRKILADGGNVAVVTMTGSLDAYRDHQLGRIDALLPHYRVNGDRHDLTFLHLSKSILVLRAKGRARKDTTGFVLNC